MMKDAGCDQVLKRSRHVTAPFFFRAGGHPAGTLSALRELYGSLSAESGDCLTGRDLW